MRDTRRFTDNVSAVPRKSGMWDIIDKEGKVLSSNLCLAWIYEFSCGFARVQRHDRLWNFIDTEGNLLFSNKWFTWVTPFKNGLAQIQCENNLWNFIDTDGKILSPKQWFTSFIELKDGIFHVIKDSFLSNIMDKDGNFLIKDKWVLEIRCPRMGCEYLIIMDEDKRYNFFSLKERKVIWSNEWFIEVSPFANGYARVQNYGTLYWNYIDENGKLLSPKQWFRYNYDFKDDYAAVRNNDGQWNFINNRGRLLSPNLWFNSLQCCNSILMGVVNGMRYYLKNGVFHQNLLS